MKRKRFIKLAMSKGLSRKTANHMAEIVLDRGGTYVHAWQYFLFLKAEIEREVRAAIENRILYGDPELRPYMGMQSQIPDPDELTYKMRLRIDTTPLPNLPTVWPKHNPYLDGISTGPAMLDELETAAGGGKE